MEQYQAAFNHITASADFKRRMVGMMLEQNSQRAAFAPRRAAARQMSAKRKALLIVMAAALLLLSACAAYAVYWSSTQRAISNATENMEMPAGQLQQDAETYADGIVKASTLTAPLTGSATVGDVTIQMVSVDVFEDTDGAEYVFSFSALSDTIGFITSFEPCWLEEDAEQDRLQQYDSFCEIGIDARDFVLTIDGQAFSPYAKPDDNGVAQPASGWYKSDDDSEGTSSLMIRQSPIPISQDSSMNLSGTLYSCDASGVRTGTIGTFSIDFSYQYPAEQAEAIRLKSIDSYIQYQQALSAARLDSLGDLPTQSTPVGLTQDILTLDDVTVLEDGLLLGYTYNYAWEAADGTTFDSSQAGPTRYYLDGYCIEPEVMDRSWSEEKLPEPDEFGEYSSKTASGILKIPYYRSTADMPEELLVYVTRRNKLYDYYESKWLETQYPFTLDLIFRVNRSTGAVTLPKDDAEKESWLAEQAALASDGRNDARDYAIHQEQTIGDMTVLLERMLYYPNNGLIMLYAFIPVIDCEVMPWEIDPVVTIDGETLTDPQQDTYGRALTQSTPAPFETNIDEWIETYGLDANRYCWYQFYYQAPDNIIDMPDSFTLDFTWDVYDLGADANREFIGTFDFEATIHKNDYLSFELESMGYDMEWMRPAMEEYGVLE